MGPLAHEPWAHGHFIFGPRALYLARALGPLFGCAWALYLGVPGPYYSPGWLALLFPRVAGRIISPANACIMEDSAAEQKPYTHTPMHPPMPHTIGLGPHTYFANCPNGAGTHLKGLALGGFIDAAATPISEKP